MLSLVLLLVIPGAGTAAQDVVTVSDNPAYQQVTVQRIELKENSAYCTVHPAAASTHQYEDITQFRVEEKHEGECSKESGSHVYEDVSKN